MAASITDKFKKVSPNTGWQLNASGIADASVTSFTLVSATGLPTDTAVILTVDRVDSSGTKTPSKMERIKGIISGSNVISCVRGVGGTAQSHSGGAVVEIVIDSVLENEKVDGILVEHNQDGTHNFASLTSKTTPIDADSIPLVDSAASNLLKRVTWSNVKATLLTYFNTVLQPKDGWIDISSTTLTYSSTDGPTFVCTTSSDLTGSISVGMKIKLTHSATTKYFFVTAIASGTITLYGGTDYTLAATAITAPYYSNVKAPYGFPIDPAKWTQSATDSTLATQATPTANTWYNLATLSLSVPIGAWRLGYYAVGQINDATAGNYVLQTTLSTANNTESDTDFTQGGSVYFGAASGASHGFHKEKHVALTSKTSYFLNTRTTSAGVDNLYNRGDQGKTLIRAVCAYL